MSGMPGSLMCPSWCTAGKSILHQIFPVTPQPLIGALQVILYQIIILYLQHNRSSSTVALCHTSLSTFLCSAGVGRTGTYIALDITLDQMKAEKTVDIKGTLEKMRERRMNMIQTGVCVKPSTIIRFGWVIQAVQCLHPVYI